jgi:D-aspartate ligase
MNTLLIDSRVQGVLIIGGHYSSLVILRSIARRSIPTILLDHKICIGQFSQYADKFIRCPPPQQENSLFDFLLRLAQENNLVGWVLFPADEYSMVFLSKNKDRLEKLYRVPVSPWDTLRAVSDKKLAYQLAQEIGISTPLTCFRKAEEGLNKADTSCPKETDIPAVTQFPALLMPSCWEPLDKSTHTKVITVNNMTELQSQFHRLKLISPQIEIAVQELIPNHAENWHSVVSFFKKGEMKARVVTKWLSRHPEDYISRACYAVTENNPELERTAAWFLRATGYYGLSELKFVFDARDGRYKLIEINPYPGRWYPLAIRAGVDLPYFIYLDSQGKDLILNSFAFGVKWGHPVSSASTILQKVASRKHSSSHPTGPFTSVANR